jgi:hypothetical protein
MFNATTMMIVAPAVVFGGIVAPIALLGNAEAILPTH